MKEFSQVDLARLAAFIDGEGCIGIHEHKRKGGRSTFYVRLEISNTDPRLAVWCKHTFGGSYQTAKRPISPRARLKFPWGCVSKTATSLLRLCTPFLILKQEQADIALAFQATVKRVGVKGHSVEVIAYRRLLKEKLSRLKWQIFPPPSEVEDLTTKSVN
jgi:hypothetical protein